MVSRRHHKIFEFSNSPTWWSEARLIVSPLKRGGLARPLDLRLLLLYDIKKGTPKSSSSANLITVNTEVNSIVPRIFFSWRLLNGILRRHEALLAKRWSEKTDSERRNLLSEIWPGISLNHRPDLQVLQTGKAWSTLDAQLWPFVNLEDLVDKQILPLFIRSRGRHPPPVFAQADLESCRLGIVSGGPLKMLIKDLPQLPEYTILMQEADSEHTYGSITPLSLAPPSQVMWAPAIGLIVLKLQDRLLNFLLHCCRCPLLDEFIVGPLKDFNPASPDPGDISVASAQGDPEYRSIVAVNTEATYRLPTVPDFAFLLGLVKSKRCQTEDTFFALREDPSLFVTRVQDELDHSPHLVWAVNAFEDPRYREKGREQEQDRLVVRMTEALFTLQQGWAIIERQLQSIVALGPHQIPTGSFGKLTVSRELALSLHQCWHTLTRLKEYLKERLRDATTCCPALRNDWEQIRHPDGLGRYELRHKVETRGDRLLTVLNGLCHEKQDFFFGAHNWIDEAERLFQKDKTQRTRVSNYALEWIAELGVIAEVQRQLQLFQIEDWASDDIRDLAERNRQYNESMISLDTLKESMTGLRLWDLANPAAEVWTYPYDKRLTKPAVHQLRLAEARLATLWDIIDARILERTNMQWFELLDVEMRQSYSTSPYKEQGAKQIKIAKIRGSLAAPRSLSMLRKQQAEMTSQATEQNDGTQSVIGTNHRRCKESPKEVNPEEATQCKETWMGLANDERFDKKAASKVKTKEKTSRATVMNEGQIESAFPPSLQSQDLEDNNVEIPVSQNAMQVLRALWASADRSGSQPKQVPWRNFLQAMNAAGLTPHNVYGSVWHFFSNTASGRTAINIHEPHPESSLSPFHLRQIGRGLTRAFHWDDKTFVPEI